MKQIFTFMLLAALFFVVLPLRAEEVGGDVFSILSFIWSAFDWANIGAAGVGQIIAFLVIAFVGVIAHFLVDVKKGLVDGGVSGLFKYLFVENIAASLKTLTGLFSSAVAWFAINPIPAPWPSLIMAAFLAGYTMDSILNRAKTPLAA